VCRASLDINEEVEQESIDKDNPVVLDLWIFLEYYVRRVETLKSSTEGKSTKNINRKVMTITTKNRMANHTAAKSVLATEPRYMVDLTSDPEQDTSSPSSSFTIFYISNRDFRTDREDPLGTIQINKIMSSVWS
jgi:hypothetical protein